MPQISILFIPEKNKLFPKLSTKKKKKIVVKTEISKLYNRKYSISQKNIIAYDETKILNHQ